MARTLAEIRASRPMVDRRKVLTTTDAIIREHAAEDGSEPAAPLSDFLARRPGQRGPGRKPTKVQVTLRLEPEALDAWRGSGAGWQARINDLLVREAPKSKRQA